MFMAHVTVERAEREGDLVFGYVPYGSGKGGGGVDLEEGEVTQWRTVSRVSGSFDPFKN